MKRYRSHEQKIRSLWTAATLVLLALLAPPFAMAQFDLVAPGEESQALSGSLLWPSPVIRVCWENGAMSDPAAREWIRGAAEGTWEAVSNVDFVGWGACTTYDAHSIHVGRRTDGRNFTQGLGTQLAGAYSGLQLTFDYPPSKPCAGSPDKTAAENEQLREACIRSNAVHEFGHALGFAHEHLRDDAGEICDEQQDSADTPPEMFFTEYDAESVMNYCASSAGVVNQALEHGVELSELDVAGVLVAYGPWEDGIFISLQIEGYIEGQDNYFGGSEWGEREFDFSLNVGDATLATATQTMCIGSGNLQVRVDLAASPFGPSGLELEADTTLFAGYGCGEAPVVDSDNAKFAVAIGPNGSLAHWQEMWVSAGYPKDWGHVRLLAYRGFDLEAALDSCENCEELAENNAVPITTVADSTEITPGGPSLYVSPTQSISVCRNISGCNDPVAVARPRPIRKPGLIAAPMRRR